MNAKKALTYLTFFGIGIGLFWLAMQGVEDPVGVLDDGLSNYLIPAGCACALLESPTGYG